MGVLGRFALLAGAILALPPATLVAAGIFAPHRMAAVEAIEIEAEPGRIWPVLTDWRTISLQMDPLLPQMTRREIVGGGAPGVGRILRYRLADGRKWDQRILKWEPYRRFEFRNEQGAAAGLPGDVTMAFDLESVTGGRTRVHYRMVLIPRGFLNRAMAQVFGQFLGTLRGYEMAILAVVKRQVEGADHLN